MILISAPSGIELDDERSISMKRRTKSGSARLAPILATGVLAALGLQACGGDASRTLSGAGATFAMPLVTLWSTEYQTATGNRVDYNSIGSGGGIRAHIDRTVDFAASEAPLHPDQAGQAPGTLTMPFTIGTVSLAYNLPGIEELRLTGQVLADICLGEIERWDDDRLQELNPDAELPDAPLEVVHRSDGSGTTYVFTDYLSKVSDEWEDRVGYGTSVSWPEGIGGNGNEGVAGAIRNNPNALGYVELGYAIQTEMTTAALENREGAFIEPTLEAGTAAAAAVVDDLPAGDEAWHEVSFTDAPGEDSYPISGFSYFFIHGDLRDAREEMSRERAEAIVEWLEWAMTEGQRYNEEVSQAPIPEPVRELNLETLEGVLYQGEPLRAP